MNRKLHNKYSRLKEKIADYGSVALAFSGGVDSTFLAKTAYDTIGDRVLAITVNSEAYSPDSILDAQKLAEYIGIRHVEIHTKECDIPGFRANQPDRCYHCKKALFTIMLKKAHEEGISVLMDGSNADDLGDYRPGMRALEELDVRSPLIELGFSKNDIRTISRELELPTWNIQSFACLASRVPYGNEITPELLEKIWKAESLLREMGFKHYRVRDHGSIARLELDSEGMTVAMKEENRDKIVTHMKSCGYTYITLDLKGFRSGSMNEVLPSSS